MIEYSLIIATVTIAFAVAGRLGVSDVFIKNLETADQTYNIPVPDNLDPNDPSGLASFATEFNSQIPLR